MKIKFLVMDKKWDKEVNRFDKYEEAEDFIRCDLIDHIASHSLTEYYILKIWTNEGDL